MTARVSRPALTAVPVPDGPIVGRSYPVDRLRELKERAAIGRLAENFYSFMGALRTWDMLEGDTGP